MAILRLFKALLIAACSWGGAWSQELFTVGWQSPNGAASTYNISHHTFDYIGKQLGVQFQINPYLDDADLLQAANQGITDFSYAGPTSIYCVILSANVQPLVTINNFNASGSPYSTLSGSIITLTTSGIKTYADIVGKTVAAGQFTGLTTLQSEFFLLQQNGVSLFTDAKAFVGYRTTPQIINAVLSKTVDVGFIESSQLSALQRNGTDTSHIQVVQPMQYANSPFVSSTPTYSSAVLAASSKINNTFRTQVVRALLALEPDSEPCTSGKYAGWVIPQSFLTIRKLLTATGSLTAGGNACTNFSSIYDFVVCPAGYQRKNDVTLDNSCNSQGFTCPVGSYLCICSPCQPIKGPQMIGHLRTTYFVIIAAVFGFVAAICIFLAIRILKLQRAIIPWKELHMTDIEVGRSAKGRVLKGCYKSIPIAVKRATPSQSCYWSVFDHDDMPERSACFQKGTMLSDHTHKVLVNALLHLKIFSKTQRLIFYIHKAHRLRHGNVLPILGCSVGEHGDEVLVVTEFAEKGTLEEVMTNKTIETDEVMRLDFARDVARGMAYLHCVDPPVFTRNVRTHHILVDEDMRARIGVSLAPFKRLSVYNPPEVVRGQPQTAASNVYKYGMLLYELVFAKPTFVFVLRSEEQMVEAIMDADSFNINEMLPKPPRAAHPLWPLMQQCWSLNPNDRPSFAAVLKQVEQYADSINIQSTRLATHDKRLLDSMLPPSVILALQEGREVQPEHYDSCSIFFSDIVGFTAISHLSSPSEVMQMLDRLYKAFDSLVQHHDLFKVETIGDAYMVASNVQRPHPNDHAARLVRFARDALQIVKTIPIDNTNPNSPMIQIRCGIHSGKCVASVVGSTNPRYCLFGDTINLASRMESMSQPGRLQISEDCRKLVVQQDPELARDIVKRPGRIDCKGKGRLKTYWVMTPEEAAARGYNNNATSTSPVESRHSLELKRGNFAKQDVRIDIPGLMRRSNSGPKTEPTKVESPFAKV